MSALGWLTARPIAHRGLHDAARGVIENTASAFAAAVEAGYGIECDVQLSADGEAMVHHDDALGRLTEGAARLDTLTAAELKRVPFKATRDAMLTLGELSELVGGRATLLVEMKSRFDGERALVARVAKVLASYRGPVAAMSFDPAQVAALREAAPQIVRGVVAERRYRPDEWNGLPAAARRAMTYFTHALRTRPHFIAYSVKDLPAPVPTLARTVLGLPVLTWTVRTSADRARAARYADQMIFEGFRP
jgi:glycerophosphoryl diester phosphodiesterase